MAETGAETGTRLETSLKESDIHVTDASNFLVITEAAKVHFRNLLKSEDTVGMNLRVKVSRPETAQAEVSVTFCPEGEEKSSDIPFNCIDFTVFVDNASKGALEKANIDFKEDKAGGQLSIKAPFLKGRAPATDSPLQERIQFVIDSEINPNLASHGGRVSITEILQKPEGAVVILQFGGGCHGCGMAGVTLKHGIEKTLKEKFSEIVEIRDATDHTTGEDPYC